MLTEEAVITISPQAFGDGIVISAGETGVLFVRLIIR
jgi:hypothetical protein